MNHRLWYNFRIYHKHSNSCGAFDNGICSVTTHSCDGIDDLTILKRKIKTRNHVNAVDEPLYTIPQVREAAKRDNKDEILTYLSKKSTTGPVTVMPDNIEEIMGSRSSIYQSVRRAQDWLRIIFSLYTRSFAHQKSRNYLDHQIGAKKIELKGLKSVSSNSRVSKNDFESNDSEISSPVSQVNSILLD